tara:strand:+ start:180 stop:503 length:324 start_codon:yes stop_codon:yes gene_type:complete
MKTQKLTGSALDWAVGTAMKLPPPYWADGKCASFSTDWAQGGPIIERECIDLQYQGGETDIWAADMCGNESSVYGNTPLIATMRCFVASKMGDDVELPEELKCMYGL